MTIPMLSGWADSLKDLPTLGNNLAHILNPQMDAQRQLQMAVAQNPEIAQHLANLEAQNPGIIGRMFGQNNQGVNSIAGMAPDTATQIDMATQPQLKTALANPQNVQEIVQKRAGFDSPEQRIIDKNRATSSNQQVQLGGQEIQLNQGLLEDRARQTATENVAKAAWSRKPFNAATFTTDYTPEEQAALFGSKQYGPLINRQLLQYTNQQDKKFEMQMHQEDRIANRQLAADNFVRNRTLMMGQKIYEDSNGAITVPDALQLATPEGQAKAQALASNPQTANSSLAKAWQFQQAVQKAARDRTQAYIDAESRVGKGKANSDPVIKSVNTLNQGVSDAIGKAQSLINPSTKSGKKPANVDAIYPYLQDANTKLFYLGDPSRYAYDAKQNQIIRVPNGASMQVDLQGHPLPQQSPPVTAASGPTATAAPPPATGAVAEQPKVLSPASQKAQQILAADPSKKQTIIEHYPEVAKELGLIQ